MVFVQIAFSCLVRKLYRSYGLIIMKKTYTIEGFDIVEKIVPKDRASSSARPYLPYSWRDKKVAIVLLEDVK